MKFRECVVVLKIYNRIILCGACALVVARGAFGFHGNYKERYGRRAHTAAQGEMARAASLWCKFWLLLAH